MSSTFTNINTNILNKFNQLKKILSYYNEYDMDDIDNRYCREHLNAIENELISYELDTIIFVKNYNSKNNTQEDRYNVYMKFMKYVNSENILGKLKRIYTFCKKLQNTYDISNDLIEFIFKTYDSINIDIMSIENSNTSCDCGNNFTAESKTSENICICGKIETLYGVVFEDEQFYFQEGKRSRHGKYDPTKHCKFWLDRIQAKENIDIPEDIIANIKARMKRDCVWIENLTCIIIRKYLKEIKKTRFNDHVPLIKKLITNKELVQLSDHERKLTSTYFGKVIQIFNKIKSSDVFNSPYHPYFIYKIIEQLLKGDENITRKRDILSCIHLQSRETLIRGDLIWKQICSNIQEFDYIPTEPS